MRSSVLSLSLPSRRGRAVVGIVAIALSLVVGRPAAAVQDTDAEQQLVDLANAERAAAGAPALQSVLDVRDVAYSWATVMASERTLHHNTTSTGSATNYYEQFCCWTKAAENVGWTTIANPDDPAEVADAVQRVHQAFMNSAGHRANILNSAFDHVGMGIEIRRDSCPSGTSIPHCLWVTQNFRKWNGQQPAGGVQDPYPDTSKSGAGATAVTADDTVRPGGFDGDVRTVERLGRTGDVGVQVSRARFADGAATVGVLAREDVFADALAGSALAADGPMLFTPSTGLSPAVEAELRRVLPSGATVYLLGGTASLSDQVRADVTAAGFVPVRLSGPNRVDTALTIADEVRARYGDNGVVALARAWGPASDPNGTAAWVDSITGGAWAASQHVPVLVTHSDTLDGPVADWLAADAPTATVLLGGTASLSDAIAAAAPNSGRVYGRDRAATAAEVSRRLWGVSSTSGGRRFLVIDGWDARGWQGGLAGAGLASDASAPVLLASANADLRPADTISLVRSCSTASVDVLLLGGLGDDVASWLEAEDGAAC